MTVEINVPTPETEVVPPVVVPPAPVEKRYEYQPTDDQGRPVGGKQVILYNNDQELAEKLRDQNVQLIRKLREVTKKQRLGIAEDEHLPDEAERFENIVEFKSKELTAEEKFQIAQDLSDPDKFDSARDRLLESAVGATAGDLRKTLNQQQILTMQLMARNNYEVFRRNTGNFHDCNDNAEVLTNWMLKNKLAPTVKNFGLAYSTLQQAGLLVEAPIVREEAPAPTVQPTAPVVENTESNPQTPANPDGRITDQEVPQEKRQARVPSGLNSRIASATGVPTTSENGSLSLRDIEKMPSAEYARRLRDPKFVDHVNKLEADLAAKRASR